MNRNDKFDKMIKDDKILNFSLTNWFFSLIWFPSKHKISDGLVFPKIKAKIFIYILLAIIY